MKGIMNLELNHRMPNEVIGEERGHSISERMLIRLFRFLTQKGKEGLFSLKNKFSFCNRQYFLENKGRGASSFYSVWFSSS